MSGEDKHTITQLLQDISQFNSNDLLVSVVNGALTFEESNFSHPIHAELKSILNTANKTQKELGLFPLCVSKGIIEWEFKQKTIETALMLFPVTVEISKVAGTTKFILDEENGFINPFLANRLRKEFETELPGVLISVEELQYFLELNGFKKVNSSKQFIGNFHPQRFEIIKELEELLLQESAEPLLNLLGLSETIATKIELGNELLFSSDVDQLAVFQSISENHTVVQGPPGTGKTQILSNLLGKILNTSASALVVSEKRVALEVLQKKMHQAGLGDLCFIATSETVSKDFLNDLKNSWNRLERQNLKAPKTNLLLSEQYLDQLQQLLDVLNQSGLIGGLNYSEFTEYTKGKKLDQTQYSSAIPNLKEWISEKEIVKELYDEDIASLVGMCSFSLFQQETFSQIDSSIDRWIDELAKLNQLFEITTFQDVLDAMKKAALCHNFNNPIVSKHEQILIPESKEQKRFVKLRKRFLQAQFIQNTLDLEKAHWKKFPSLIETEVLLTLFQNKSYIGAWKFKKQWKLYTNLPPQSAEDVLHKWKQYLVNSNLLSQIKIEFCEIGVDDLENEMEMLHQQIHLFTQNDRNNWLEIPSKKRQEFASQNNTLHQLYSSLKNAFRLEDTTNLVAILNAVKHQFPALVSNQHSIQKLSELTHRNLNNYSTFDDYENAVCKSSWVKFTSQYPVFSKFSPNDLKDKCEAILTSRTEESTLLSETIQYNQFKRFNYFHSLLNTVPAKLTAEEKELRSRLKKGKALLVKEFAKTRNHPSLRELFASDALEWLRLFKPIWLSNPTQVAQCFPLQKELFDFAIFDEASQIPLQNALGSIQRAKRVLVAGDQQQMGTSSYFKAQSEETIDVLHQANFYWKNTVLKHHYRSENPELIKFSNAHFYHNELVSFPSASQEKEPISFQYIENSVFDERKNHEEAKKVSLFIEKHIQSKSHLGIVAFSESQLAEIYSCLKPKTRELVELRIDDSTLFFKALENVQGEECDHLIISLGYGKNTEGEFHMRFGPVNSKNGPKRLNVLLTRARQKIDFFASVTSSDFKLSANEGVNLLRLYLLQIENHTFNQEAPEFPFGLTPEISNETLTFERVFKNLHNAEELVTLYSVLKSRGWKTKFN